MTKLAQKILGLLIGAAGFVLPLSLLTSTQAILARKRSGKSYTASVQAEELLEAGQQIAVIDPTGAWWGIRASADGEGPGYPVVVFGGDHADVPLDPNAGRMLARALIEHGFSAIFDVGTMDTLDQIRFVTAFSAEMLKLNRKPIHIFIDEADTFAPQLLEGKEQKVCLGTVSRLVKQGGIRGLGVTMITQRPADLNKKVLSQVDLVTVLRMSHPTDIKPTVDWIKAQVSVEFANQVEAALPSLPVGEAFICSASLGIAERVRVRQRRTFNSGATPVAGELLAAPKVLAAVDREKLGREIRASIEAAQGDDPEFLRRRIRELEANVGLSDEVKAVEEELNETRGQLEREREETAEERRQKLLLRGRLELIDSKALDAQLAMTNLYLEIQKTREALGEPAFPTGPPQEIGRTAAGASYSLKHAAIEAAVPSERKLLEASTPAPAAPAPTSNGHIPPVQFRILGALAQFRQIGITEPDRTHVCLFSGYSNTTSKGFVNAVGGLRSAGLIDYPKQGTIALTDDGIALAPALAPLRGNRELHEKILGMLSPKEGQILTPILEAYPDAVSRTSLMEGAGYGNATSKGFVNAIGRLSGLGFVTYPSPGQVRASELCFIRGRK